MLNFFIVFFSRIVAQRNSNRLKRVYDSLLIREHFSEIWKILDNFFELLWFFGKFTFNIFVFAFRSAHLGFYLFSLHHLFSIFHDFFLLSGEFFFSLFWRLLRYNSQVCIPASLFGHYQPCAALPLWFSVTTVLSKYGKCIAFLNVHFVQFYLFYF